MSRRTPIAIVGGGVLGLSLARALALRGAGVTLFTEAETGGGASAVPVALLNPYRGRTGRAHADDLAALAVTWRWAAELRRVGLDPGAERSGVVRIADGADQARAFAAVAGLRPFGPAEAPPPFRAPHGGAWVDDGGWVDPARWCAALARSAAAAGAEVVRHANVAAIEPDGPDGWRLTTDGGASSRHRQVVVAVGAGAVPEHHPPAWRWPDLARLAGDVVRTGQAAPRHPLAGAVYVGPIATPTGPRAAIGGHHRPVGPPSPDAAGRLRDRIAWAWPALGPAEPTDAVWWGVRARTPDGRPDVRELAPGAWWAGGLAGRGFLAAAALAEAAVDRLLAATRDPAGATDQAD